MSRQARHTRTLTGLAEIRRVQKNAAEHRLSLADRQTRQCAQARDAAGETLAQAECDWLALAAGEQMNLPLMQSMARQVLTFEAGLGDRQRELDAATTHRTEQADAWRSADARLRLSEDAERRARRELVRRREEVALAEAEDLIAARRPR